MRSKIIWLLTVLLCLMVYAPAKGAIVWDPASFLHPKYGIITTLVENYPILNNGGTFAVVTSDGHSSYYQSTDVTPGTQKTSNIIENFNGHGHMTLNAEAQGEFIDNGFKTQVQSSIEFYDMDGPPNYFAANGNAVDVIQSVSATMSRKFENDGGTLTTNLTAQLAGSVNFNSLDEVAEYEITAYIDLLEYGPDGESANVYHLEMTEDPDTWNQVIENIVLRSMSGGFYYQLNCGLHVDVRVKNLSIDEAGFYGIELNGPFQLGDQNPLILNTGLTDVHPISTGPDSNSDGDVDGLDLAIFAEEVGRGTNSVGIEEFADNFGKLP